jgi:hypothetical protein
MKTKAQAALEYLMIVGLAFVIIMPMVYMFYSYTVSTQEEVGMAKIHKIGVDIAAAAEDVYYLGEPSRSTIKVNMPEMIAGVSVLDAAPGYTGSLIIFYFGDVGLNQSIVIPSKIPLDLDLNEEDYSPGRKEIIVEATSQGARIKGEE